MNSGHLSLTGAIRLFPDRAVRPPLSLAGLRRPRPWLAALGAVLKFAGVQIAAGLGCLALLPMLGVLMLAATLREHPPAAAR